MEAGSNVAVIDIGTNSIKLLIARRLPNGSFEPLIEKSEVTRLGEGLANHRLSETAMLRTLQRLKHFRETCRQYGVNRVTAVGTAALREASNRVVFARMAAEEAAIVLDVISGEEEARLSYLAVFTDPKWREAGKLAVVDVGGGSTEMIAPKEDGSDLLRISLPLGAVRLSEQYLRSDPLPISQLDAATREVDRDLSRISLPQDIQCIVGVGGTIVNLAAVKLGMQDHEPAILHGQTLRLLELETMIERFAQMTIAERKRVQGLEPERADTIVGGTIVLAQVVSHLQMDEIEVSTRGLRWGVLYERYGRAPETAQGDAL